MNRRLTKLIKEYEKYQDKVIDLSCENNYILKENLKDQNQNIYLNIKNKEYQDIEDLFNFTIISLYKSKYIKKINNEQLSNQNIFYINYLNNDNYVIDSNRGLIDYEELQNQIINTKPNYIYVGSSYYTRFIDYKKIKEIASIINAYLIVDISYISGLILTNKIPSPFEYADYIVCNLSKQLQGKDLTILLSNNHELDNNLSLSEIIIILNTLLNVSTEEYKELMNNILNNTKELQKSLLEEDISLISHGTDNNLIWLDPQKNYQITCKETFNLLFKNDIIIKENNLGILINTSNMTFKGYTINDFYLLGKKINKILKEK